MNEMPAAPGSIQDEITQMKEPLEVSVAPQQVIEGAMMRMTTQGYSVEMSTEGSITFARTEGPSIIVGLFLLVLFILPGLIYFLIPRSPKHTTLLAEEVSGGSRLTLGGDDFHGQRTLREWMDTLPKLGQG
jgi:hypothetical protein